MILKPQHYKLVARVIRERVDWFGDEMTKPSSNYFRGRTLSYSEIAVCFADEFSRLVPEFDERYRERFLKECGVSDGD